jgi:NitT/TauT family transport system substrate-binding protein
MMQRPAFLRAGAATAAAMFVPRVARTDDATITMGALTFDPAAEPYFAQDGGFFKKHGLNVDIQPFTSGVAALAALFGGSIDIAISDAVGAAAAHSRGLPVTYLAPACVFTQAAPASFLVVLASSPVKTAKDLNGKSIATNGLKNIVQIPTSAWIDNNGGDSKSVKFIELPVPQMAGAVEEGRLDAAIMSEPFITSAQGGNKFRVISIADNNVAPAFLYGGWASTIDWAEKNPDVVKRFVIAMNETAKWSNANHALTAPILTKISKVPLELTMKMNRVYFGEKFILAQYQPVIDACAKYGAIAKSFPAAELINAAALK